jgi:hypothetical protein
MTALHALSRIFVVSDLALRDGSEGGFPDSNGVRFGAGRSLRVRSLTGIHLASDVRGLVRLSRSPSDGWLVGPRKESAR